LNIGIVETRRATAGRSKGTVLEGSPGCRDCFFSVESGISGQNLGYFRDIAPVGANATAAAYYPTSIRSSGLPLARGGKKARQRRLNREQDQT